MNLLVIASDKKIFDVIRETNYSLVRAATIAAAIEVLQEHIPDAVIFDNELVGIKKIKKFTDKKKITLVIIGIDLPKPFTLDEFQQFINKMSDQGQAEAKESTLTAMEPFEENLRLTENDKTEKEDLDKKIDLNKKIDELLSRFNCQRDKENLNDEKTNLEFCKGEKEINNKVNYQEDNDQEDNDQENNCQEVMVEEFNFLENTLKGLGFDEDCHDRSYPVDANNNKEMAETEEGCDIKKASPFGSIFGRAKENKFFDKETEYFYIPHQEVITIASVKGGTGKTSLAIALAMTIRNVPTLIIDMNFADGGSDLSCYLNLPQLPNWGHFLRNKTKEGLKEAILQHESISVLQVPPRKSLSKDLAEDDIARVIDLAKRLYSVIIIDLPTSIDPIALEAIDLSTVTVIVSEGQLSEVNRIKELKNRCERPVLVFNKGKKLKKMPKQFLPEEILTLEYEDKLEQLIGTGKELTKSDILKNNAIRVNAQVFPKAR